MFLFLIKEIMLVFLEVQRVSSLPETGGILLCFKAKFNVPEYNKGTKTRDADTCWTQPS